MSSHIDRNLLFGFLALQNGFITRNDVVAAVSLWLTDKSRQLEQILAEQGALASDEQRLVTALVQKHLERHGNNTAESLASLSTVGLLRDDLKQLNDSALDASLAHISIDSSPAQSQDSATVEFNLSRPGSTRFHIVRPHAKGGLGQVYLAKDLELNRHVALKEIQHHYADDPDSRARFVLEAEITGGLEHPGIVPVYGMGQYADGRPYYAMRFIRGDSLKEAIEQYYSEPKNRDAYDSVEFRKLLGRFIDVCNAIEYAHSRGVLHRDLKPGNIMLGKFGETLVVDWGLAKIKGRGERHRATDEATFRPSSGSGSTSTRTGAVVGTLSYMSPEQAAGRLEELGAASDVYSLGATLYYLITGHPPFNKEEGANVIRKIQEGEFNPPRKLLRHVPKPLEAICLKAMSLTPSERYASPVALAEDLERYLADEPIRARREPVVVRARRWLRKHPRSVSSVAAALLVGVVSALSSAGIISSIVANRNQQLLEFAQSTANQHHSADVGLDLRSTQMTLLYRQAVALHLIRTNLGPEHPVTLATTLELGKAYLMSDDPEKALPYFHHFVTQQRKLAKPDDPEFANLLEELSRNLLRHRVYPAAATYLRECLAIREKKLANDWSRFHAMSMLGAALAAQQEFNDAERWSLEGYQGLKQRAMEIPINHKPSMTEAVQRLIDLYTGWDRPEEAAKWRKILTEGQVPAAQSENAGQPRADDSKE